MDSTGIAFRPGNHDFSYRPVQNSLDHFFLLAKGNIRLNDEIIKRAYEFQGSGLKAFDSLHVAIAEYSKADVFLTTDKELLRITKRLKLGIKTVNPLNWFMEVDENE